MNGFFEDLEDGWEPLEAEEEGWRSRTRPDWDTLAEWLAGEAGCEATDGCWVEPDGTCPHGCQSWLLVLGLI